MATGTWTVEHSPAAAVTSAHGPGYIRQGGFTLLEIMLVVLLIGLAATMVTIRFERDPDNTAKLEAHRFAAYIDHLRDESVMLARGMGIQLDLAVNSYRFLANGKPLENDPVLKVRKVPEDIDLELEVFIEDSDPLTPLIETRPDGDIDDFRLVTRGDDWSYVVAIDEDDAITVTRQPNEAR